MASVFDNHSNGTRKRDRTKPAKTTVKADAPVSHPTFVVASASAAAVPITAPLGDADMRKYFSHDVLDAVARARRDAGVA
jgi:hypothetical protein